MTANKLITAVEELVPTSSIPPNFRNPWIMISREGVHSRELAIVTDAENGKSSVRLVEMLSEEIEGGTIKTARVGIHPLGYLTERGLAALAETKLAGTTTSEWRLSLG